MDENILYKLIQFDQKMLITQLVGFKVLRDMIQSCLRQVYSFILAVEMLAIKVCNKTEIHGIHIGDREHIFFNFQITQLV